MRSYLKKILYAALCLGASSLFVSTSFAVQPQERDTQQIDDIQSSSRVLLERATRMNPKVEMDQLGRATKVTMERAQMELSYTKSGKLTSVTSNGQTLYLRVSNDSTGKASLIFTKSDGTELQAIDLVSIGFWPEFIGSVVQIVSEAENANGMPWHNSNSTPNEASSLRSSKTVPPIKVRSAILGEDGPTYVPQACLKCDLDQQMEINACDREASIRQGSCATGVLLFSETGPAAVAFGIACLAASASRTADCKNNAAQRRYECMVNCN